MDLLCDCRGVGTPTHPYFFNCSCGRISLKCKRYQEKANLKYTAYTRLRYFFLFISKLLSTTMGKGPYKTIWFRSVRHLDLSFCGGLLNHYCACRSETGQSSLNHQLLAFFSSSWIQKTACVPDKQRLNHVNSAIFQMVFKWHLDSTEMLQRDTIQTLEFFQKVSSSFFLPCLWSLLKKFAAD